MLIDVKTTGRSREREGGREGGRERNIPVQETAMVPSHRGPGRGCACSLGSARTGDPTAVFCVVGQCSSQLSHDSQDWIVLDFN